MKNLRRDPLGTVASTLGRREILQAGLAGTTSLLTGLPINRQAAFALQKTEADGKGALDHYVIDVHCHPRWAGYNGARMIKNMDAAGIQLAWLLSWEIPEREMDPYYYSEINPTGVGMPFRDVIDVVERYPDRFIPGTTVDPRDPHAHERLKAAVDTFRVRVFGELKLRMRYDDPDAIRLFHYCGELGLPVIFHLQPTFPRLGVPSVRQWWYGGGLENMEIPLRLCPQTQFLGHARGFWREISADADQEPQAYPTRKPIVGRGRILEYLDKYPNLNCDLSGGSGHTALSRDLRFTRQFLTDYQDRVFFGRDEFSNRLYDLLVSLNLPAVVLTKILGGNAMRLVPL
jgi:predicted TIM-barrel fold metal-dependent hydrolase